MSDRFVLLGLAGARAAWFASVGQWAHAGSLPVDFTKCLSVEELRTRLGSGRPHSAVLLDGALPAVDRDLIDAARRNGSAVLVVDHADRAAHWASLGADSTLPSAFGPAELLTALRAHAAAVPSATWAPTRPRAETPSASGGPLIALCGAGGTGVSTLAIALAQQLATDRRFASEPVLLADLCRRAEQAMLHDAGDVGPGVQELVDQCRSATPPPAQVRAHAYVVSERGYALLLGLRQPSAWAGLRPRAVAAAIDALRRAFGAVVCDADSDFEGQAEGGSVDVEERNALSRAAARSADVVVAVGLPGLKGLYSLARVVGDLADAGVAPSRIAPVINRMPRAPRARARAAAAFSALLSASVRTEIGSPVFIADREVEPALHDRARMPASLGDPLVGVCRAIAARVTAPIAGGNDVQPRRVVPGELLTEPAELPAR